MEVKSHQRSGSHCHRRPRPSHASPTLLGCLNLLSTKESTLLRPLKHFLGQIRCLLIILRRLPIADPRWPPEDMLKGRGRLLNIRPLPGVLLRLPLLPLLLTAKTKLSLWTYFAKIVDKKPILCAQLAKVFIIAVWNARYDTSSCSRFYIFAFSCCSSCFTIFSILHNFTCFSVLLRIFSLFFSSFLRFLSISSFPSFSRFQAFLTLRAFQAFRAFRAFRAFQAFGAFRTFRAFRAFLAFRAF